MFERFTQDARDVVARSQDEARRLQHPSLGPEHLLITADGLRSRLVAFSTDDLDADALAALGIDLERVREASEAHLGPGALGPRKEPMPRGHIPFTKSGKKVLELAVREAVRFHSGEISSAHLLLGLLREAETGDRKAPLARLLDEPEPDLAMLRSDTERLLADRVA
jgi:ATP-dependent Clp protease ATP-binding subunit ClpA